MHVIRVPECKGRREDKKKFLKNSQTISKYHEKNVFQTQRVLLLKTIQTKKAQLLIISDLKKNY